MMMMMMMMMTKMLQCKCTTSPNQLYRHQVTVCFALRFYKHFKNYTSVDAALQLARYVRLQGAQNIKQLGCFLHVKAEVIRELSDTNFKLLSVGAFLSACEDSLRLSSEVSIFTSDISKDD